MSLPAGTRLGPYEILAPIGAGGMGEVYRARDTRLDRDVAIKVLPEHLAQNPVALSRFKRESKAVAALSHPNILALYDVGAEQGITFAVMELLEGETLRQRLEQGALPWRKALAIAVAVADALAAAHRKGIIHRDLKPDNIFLTSDGRVKILDFGVARVQPPVSPQEQAGLPTETEAGTVMGTPGYMSPEQVRGDRTDVPSDIFSFGCVVYEMLTQRRAFARRTAAETMAAILEAEPRALAGTNRQIPEELERVVMHCLEKNSRQRFQSADDLAFALRAVQAPALAAAIPGRWRRLRPVWLASALALLLAGASVYWLNRPGRAIDSLAVLPFANVGADPNKEYLSDGITENLINSLSQLPKLRVIARSLAFRYKGPQVDPQKAGRDLRVRAVLTGRVTERDGALNIQAELVNVEDGAQLWGGQYSRRFSEILALEQELARTVSARLHPGASSEHLKRLAATRSTENAEAYQLYLKGRYYWNRRTEQALKRAVEYFQQATEKDPGYALAYAGLADCYAVYNSYKVELPRQSGPKAKAAAAKALEIDNTLAEAHASLGMTRMSYEWDWVGAERDFQRAIELDPNYATAHHWYGICLSATGRSEQAIVSLQRAQQLDPVSLIINADIGLALHLARRYDEAIEQIRKAQELDPNFTAGRRHLGMAYEQKGMYAEAVAELQKAVNVSPGSPFALGSLGHAYAVSGDREKARQVLADLRELSRRRYVSPFDTAVIYAGMDDEDRAVEWLEKAFDDRSLEMIFLKVDPRFDSLRADPRFVNLLRRMGLAP
jgi:serine/threonine protein kinase/tetratricopeptide (TPR) repeat protein